VIYGVTGHRPDKLGGYHAEAWTRLCGFAALTVKRFEPDAVVLGMAVGWDMAVASACVALRVPFVAAIPFHGQQRLWPDDKQRLYRLLLTQAERVHVVSNGPYAVWKMLRRNEWMVNEVRRNAGEFIALWNGEAEGGTYRCVEYARRREVKITNVWEEWKVHSEGAES
jgi:uncharacterized phage-like protein YoqJ